MGAEREFALPDVGEGLTEAEIVSWRVRPGDTVKVNDPIVEIETAKSLVELPCPFAGTVTGLLVEEGTTVEVGAPLLRVDVGGAGPVAAPSTSVAGSAATTAGPTATASPAGTAGPAAERTSVLVGYGPRTDTPTTRRRRRGMPAPAEANGHAGTPAATAPAGAAGPAAGLPPASPAPAATAPPAFGAPPSAPPVAPAATAPGLSSVASALPADVPAAPESPVRPLAKPPVRKLAKDLGVDLRTLVPSGPNGTVSRSDVEAAARRAVRAPDSAAGDRETRVPVRGVRKATAEAMVASAFTAPHVTEWVAVDATRTVELVDRLRARRELADVKISPLLIVAAACLRAARRTPELNATFDAANGEIVLKRYVNLGIAVASPRGLLVPNVKDAGRLTLVELAGAVGGLVAAARAGTTPPADMLGTTFTITNVGVFGVDGGTPILTPGTSGILAVGAIRPKPWVVGGELTVRQVTTLALAFDHRVVDGEQGSRFLTDVAAIVEDPALALVLG